MRVRVDLHDSRPVWRRLEIRSDATARDLHAVQRAACPRAAAGAPGS